jgi:protein-disulfide isomerase-like protein with CxxC motif
MKGSRILIPRTLLDFLASLQKAFFVNGRSSQTVRYLPIVYKSPFDVALDDGS